MRSTFARTRGLAVIIAAALAFAACGSSPTTGQSSAGSSAGATQTSGGSAGAGAGSAGSGSGSTALHTAAIKACDLIDEATMSTLDGFPARYFGAGDPVARVPVAARSMTNTNGAPIRISDCGYWETGVAAELSRDIVVEVIQGDPAKPGSASTDAAHGEFVLVRSLAADQQPQPLQGIGDEAFAVTKTSGSKVIVRSGDVVVSVEGDSPPNTQPLTIDTLTGVAKAIVAHL